MRDTGVDIDTAERGRAAVFKRAFTLVVLLLCLRVFVLVNVGLEGVIDTSSSLFTYE